MHATADMEGVMEKEIRSPVQGPVHAYKLARRSGIAPRQFVKNHTTNYNTQSPLLSATPASSSTLPLPTTSGSCTYGLKEGATLMRYRPSSSLSTSSPTMPKAGAMPTQMFLITFGFLSQWNFEALKSQLKAAGDAGSADARSGFVEARGARTRLDARLFHLS